tara:strand:- start:1113 stop:1313 length:201 start_codon:yes stop_codon:yes gene_type:complete
MKGYRTLRQLDRAMKSTIRKKELIDRLRTIKDYYITPADQTILLSMLIDYEEKIEDILKDFKDRGQ